VGEDVQVREVPNAAVEAIREQFAHHIQKEVSLATAIGKIEIPLSHFEDGYPEWHPWPYPIEAMTKAFLYMRVTGTNYEAFSRELDRWQYHPGDFRLERAPHPSTFSRAWRHRFDDRLREFIGQASKAIYEEAESTVPSKRLAAPEPSDDEQSGQQFTDEQIRRTIRLGQKHAFSSFESRRADNAKYEDDVFHELQSFLCMNECGTPQGSRRFRRRSPRDETPHGDTHLRTVKKFDEEVILDNYHQAAGRMVEVLRREGGLREPVTVAIDTTEEPFWNPEGMDRTGWTKRPNEVAYQRAHKWATLSIIGDDAPLPLAITSVVPEEPLPGRKEKPKHQIVAELLVRALDLIDVHMVYADRGFDAKLVWQVVGNLGLHFLGPKSRYSLEEEVIDRLNDEVIDVAVEHAQIQTAVGGLDQELSIIYLPSTREDGDRAVFVTNRHVEPMKAQGIVSRYDRRWRIENQYKTMANDFRAITTSRDFTVRLFYFVFRCLLYCIWRLTDVLLKLKLDLELTDDPVVTAGELVELVSDFLRPID
jgi:hypothetical protein